MNIMMSSSEHTKCNGKVRMKCWESEGGGIATRKVKSELITKVKSELITKWTFSWRGKMPGTDNIGCRYVTRKGFLKRE